MEFLRDTLSLQEPISMCFSYNQIRNFTSKYLIACHEHVWALVDCMFEVNDDAWIMIHGIMTCYISCVIESWWKILAYCGINSSPPGQNGRHFANDTFRCIFLNEKLCILFKISLKFVPKGPIDNDTALVWIMAWRRIGDKSLSEPMLTQFTDTYMRH